MRKMRVAIILFLFWISPVFADETCSELLSLWLSNDLTVQKYTILAEQAALNLDKTYINNGINITLSSGTMTFKTTDGEGVLTVKPSAELTIPQANGTSITASGTFTNSENKDSWQDLQILLMTDIISSSALSRKIEILKSKRELLEARRNLRIKALEAENNFYSALKELFEYAVDVFDKKNDLYEKQLALRKVQSQGYSRTSPTYRSAALEVQSYERKVEKAVRELNRNTAVFAALCSKDFDYDAENQSEEKALSFLPQSVTAPLALNIADFRAESYADIESAAWAHYIAELERKADTHFSLRGGAGYTFNNTDANSDTADGKLALEWGGLSASAGVALPTGKKGLKSKTEASEEKSPVYTLSLTLTPNTFRLNRISKKSGALDSDIEKIAIDSAWEDYKTAVLDKTMSLEDIVWAQKNYADEYALYASLAADNLRNFRAGIITESDYLDAKANRDMAKINALISDIDLIMYNNSILQLFHDDASDTDLAEVSATKKERI